MKQQRLQTTNDDDITVFIPKDNVPGKREERIRRAVKFLWSRGIYPGPAAMCLRLHGKIRRDLNSVEAKIRNEMLTLIKIPRQRSHKMSLKKFTMISPRGAKIDISAIDQQLVDELTKNGWTLESTMAIDFKNDATINSGPVNDSVKRFIAEKYQTTKSDKPK